MEEDLKELAESDLADPNRVMHCKDWWSLAEDEETNSEKTVEEGRPDSGGS